MYMPEQTKHRHAVIAITGFLSATQDLKNYAWLDLTNYCRVRGIPLFVLRWESRDMEGIYNMCLEKADKNDIINIMQKSSSLSELITTTHLRTAYTFAKQCGDDFINTFIHTRFKAKLTGKMLAHFLAA